MKGRSQADIRAATWTACRACDGTRFRVRL